jgi:hypothetical protein
MVTERDAGLTMFNVSKAAVLPLLSSLRLAQRKQLTVVLLSILIAGCHGASISSQNHAATAKGSHHKQWGPQPHRGASGAAQRFASASLRRLRRRMPERERQPIRTVSSSTVGAFESCRLYPPPVPASRLPRPVSRPRRHLVFVPVTLQRLPAHSMVSPKTTAIVAPLHHRTLMPPSARAGSSRLSMT